MWAIIYVLMSNEPGRNAPCPCGSGRYKRCCLPTDEAAACERSQRALFDEDAFGDSEFDIDEDEGFVDVEEDVPIVDVRALTRVCYTRGFVTKLSELRSGHGVRVTEWEAPQIPQSVLDSIEREALDTLEGEWGDPKVGNPIQVDLIDLETDSDIVSIEVFNRAIALVDGGEEVRRITGRATCSKRPRPTVLINRRNGGPTRQPTRSFRAKRYRGSRPRWIYPVS